MCARPAAADCTCNIGWAFLQRGAFAVHALLGGANLAFWPSFVVFGLQPMGIGTTAVHALFAAVHAFCVVRRRPVP